MRWCWAVLALPWHKGIDTLVETVEATCARQHRAVQSAGAEFDSGRAQRAHDPAIPGSVPASWAWMARFTGLPTTGRLKPASVCWARPTILFSVQAHLRKRQRRRHHWLSPSNGAGQPAGRFSDLPDVTWKMDGHEAEDIVRAVQVLSPARRRGGN